ncbi:MAG: hypothetical protein HFH73_13050 [Lachnospiraceae bacterium]|jgi:RNA polymerase primary sigma factor|nr:hypothetical protein [Lachnospiraceae bacterium]
MEEQSKFLETLQEIRAIANSQGNHLTKEEIRKYLGEDGLSEEKMQAVYHYLGENHITVEGYHFVPDKQSKGGQKISRKVTDRNSKKEGLGKADAKGKSDLEKGNRREANMRLYRMEIAKFHGRLEEAEDTILGFLKGDDSVRGVIIENYLQKVVELAGKYQKRNVAMDEIIAEGNVGLMTAIQIIGQNRQEYILKNGSLDYEKFFGTLNLEITHAMEIYIDEMTESKDWESAMLAKTNLLHEAAKYMAEEMGRMPTVEELSEYTKISRDEIKDIMGLSEDAKRVAQAE